VLKAWVSHTVLLGFAQAGVAAAAAIGVVLLARRRNIHVEGETAIALLRGLTQICIVGSALVLLMRGPRWTSVPILVGMMAAAAHTSARRARRIPGALRASLWGIGCGAGPVIVAMTLTGVIGTEITSLVPIGSMIIANAMNANGIALDRFRAEVQAHVGPIEAALALGAAPDETVESYVQSSYAASLIPAIDNLRSLGIVWIPGLMAGMVLSGSPPLYAAVYQFTALAMILAASGLTCLVSTTVIRRSAFSAAEQLVLRPGRAPSVRVTA
jgi:putative ABC transport system permease protein